MDQHHHDSQDYRTVRGYLTDSAEEELSPAMEDYLEMTARLCREGGSVRIGSLSLALHVKPSSASKMIAKLRDKEYLSFLPGGCICLTARGQKKADYLLLRHETIEQFLRLIGSRSALKEAELIEHCLSEDTVYALQKTVTFLQKKEKDFLKS